MYDYCIAVRYINDTRNCILEGELRCEGLAEFLSQQNAGKDVWLCEDGSGLVPKISYDSTLDQLIGMTLPIDRRTGCPKRHKSTARDQEEIKQFMTHVKSTHIYVVMAIPLKQGKAPFILQMFGTDNTFLTSDVTRRWNYTIQQLKRYFLNIKKVQRISLGISGSQTHFCSTIFPVSASSHHSLQPKNP